MMLVALTALPLICLANVGGWTALMGHLSQVSSEMPGTASANLDHWFAGLTGLVLFTFLFEDAGVGSATSVNLTSAPATWRSGGWPILKRHSWCPSAGTCWLSREPCCWG